MKIALVSAVYPPEPVVSGRMSQDLAQEMARRGAEVTVCCPQPSRPVGADYSALKAREPIVTQEDNVSIARLPSFTSPQAGLANRARESMSLGWHACRYLESLDGSFDALYVNSWPLLSQAALTRYTQRSRTRMVLHIQDIYPESMLLKLPQAARRLVHRPLWAIDRWIARRAYRVVTVSKKMRTTYIQDRGLAPAKVITINNWQDEQLFARLPARTEGCAAYGVPDNRFTFAYLGNIGPVAGVDLLIRSFAQAQLPHAQLLVIGGGSAESALRELADQLGVKNIRFISDPNSRNVPLLQSMTDVCLLPVKRGAALSSIPSKLAAYMLSAKPVLAAVDKDSDTAGAIIEAGCGWVEEPENVEGLSMRMRAVAELDPVALDEIGQRGRGFSLAHYSKAVGVRLLGDVVLQASHAN